MANTSAALAPGARRPAGRRARRRRSRESEEVCRPDGSSRSESCRPMALLAWKVRAGECVADDHHRRRIRAVAIGERAALLHLNAHHREVVGAYRQVERNRLLSGDGRRLIGAREPARAAHVAHRRIRANGRVSDAGQALQAVDDSVGKRQAGVRFHVRVSGQHHAECQDVLGPEARIHGSEATRAFKHQTRGDQQHQALRRLPR